MSEQEIAVRLAEDSLKRFGFVVVGYEPDTIERNMGIPTKFLWREYVMPQAFVPIRRATPEEWDKQRALAGEVFGRPAPKDGVAVPLVLVTD